MVLVYGYDAIHIRPSRDDDRDRISDVHRSAFGDEQGEEIVRLASDLFDDETAKPIVSLVAEANGEPIGHVIFTSVSIEPAAKNAAAMILAPVGVVQSQQRKGVGDQLIRGGLRQLASDGVKLVFVLGYPEYYPIRS